MALFTRENPNIRFVCEEDSVQVKNKYKNAWQHWRTTGLIILPSVITVNTTTLEGKAVTCVIGEESYTTTFVSGVALFKVYSEGTATITCGEYSTEVTVESGGSYTAELEEIVNFYIIKDGVAQVTPSETNDYVKNNQSGFFVVDAKSYSSITLSDMHIYFDAPLSEFKTLHCTAKTNSTNKASIDYAKSNTVMSTGIEVESSTVKTYSQEISRPDCTQICINCNYQKVSIKNLWLEP